MEQRDPASVVKNKKNEAKNGDAKTAQLIKLAAETVAAVRKIDKSRWGNSGNTIVNNVLTLEKELCALQVKYQELANDFAEIENDLLKTIYELEREISGRKYSTEFHVPSGVFIYSENGILGENKIPF